jgi:hypothetical protein
MKHIKFLLVVAFLTNYINIMAQGVITTYARVNMNTTLNLQWSSSNYGSIQWQNSTDSGNTWKDISGANDKSYSFVPTEESWIRVIVNGDEACRPIVKTYDVKVGSFNVNLVQTGSFSAIYEISAISIPKNNIVEYGFCYNYCNLSRSYNNMYREAIGGTLPNGDTFELTCPHLIPNSKYSVRVYMKTKEGSIIYGPSKITETLPGLVWSTEGWNIATNSVTAKFKLAGYTGSTASVKFQFGTEGNMETYTTTVDENKIFSATISGLQPATDYQAVVSADLDGDEQTITKTVRTWTDYSTYPVDATVKPVSHKINWDRSNLIQLSPDNIQAEYPRLIRISADSILLTYHGGDGTAVNTDHWQDIYLQRSTDNGKNWSTPEKLMDHSKTFSNQNNGWNRFSDPTFTRLANGWILMQFIGNANPETNYNCQVFVCISKDGGITWGDPITVGRGRTWEPQIIQLPGGELELLVSSEAYWWDNQRNNLFQEILCSRSTDNGLTWTAFSRASYNPGKRDGMPVPVVLQGNKGIVFSIESINSNENPSLIYRSLDGEWDSHDWDGVYDANRWVAEVIRGANAPFAIQLPTGELVVMGHLNQNGAVWQTCRSQVCIGDNTGRNFKYRTLPFSTLPTGEGAYYSSFFLFDTNTIWLATSHSIYDGSDCKKNTIEYIEGTIVEE